MRPLIPKGDEPGGEFILYQTENGRTRIQCRFEEETIWLTQAQLAELFQTTPQNVTLHLKAIFAEGELAEESRWTTTLSISSTGTVALALQLVVHVSRPSRRTGNDNNLAAQLGSEIELP